MKRCYRECSDVSIWRQPVAKLDQATFQDAVANSAQIIENLRQLVAETPWGHNLVIQNKISAPEARLFYLHATAQNGWSRAILLNQIKSVAYERSVTENKTHNFAATLPNPIGVAQYELQTKLPTELEGKLPTAEQLATVVRQTLPAKP